MKGLKVKKKRGWDDVMPSRVLGTCAAELTSVLAHLLRRLIPVSPHLFCRCMTFTVLPASWNYALVLPIPKRKEPSALSCRPYCSDFFRFHVLRIFLQLCF